MTEVNYAVNLIDESAPSTVGPLPHYAGRRLLFSDRPCTVRWSGTLPKTTGTWIGVEWDDPTDGKNNGTREGVRYFKCRSSSPTAASFIRPTRTPDSTRSFLEAVRDKYAPISLSQLVAAEAEADFRRANHGSRRPIRFGTKVVDGVGFNKIATQQANLVGLKMIAVDRWGISGIVTATDTLEEPGKGSFERGWWEKRRAAQTEIRETLPKVTELDLGGNLLELWSDVVAICAALPELKTLRLSANYLRRYEAMPAIEDYKSAFVNVTELVLDAVRLPWDLICTIVSCFPALEMLSVSFNNLTHLSRCPEGKHIRKISLNNNAFTSLSNARVLTSLPGLESLTLQSNAIHTLDPCPVFSHLTHLDLSDNKLASATSLNPLFPPSSSKQPFPELSSIRVSRNPFFTALASDTAHILALARLPQITTLNFSVVTPEERTNAELYYLSQVGAQLEAVGEGSADEVQILAENPLWAELCIKHDRPPVQRRAALVDGAFAPGTLGARLVLIRLRASRDALLACYLRQDPLPGAEWIELTREATHRNAGGAEARRLDDAGPMARRMEGEAELDAKHQKEVDAARERRTQRAQRVGGPFELGAEWAATTLRVPRTASVYALLGEVAAVYGVRPHRLRLVWETGEWDPVGREGAEGDDVWSVPEEEDDEDDEGEGKGKFVRREVEIEAGTSSLGFWIEGDEADVRIEFMHREDEAGGSQS